MKAKEVIKYYSFPPDGKVQNHMLAEQERLISRGDVERTAEMDIAVKLLRPSISD